MQYRRSKTSLEHDKSITSNKFQTVLLYYSVRKRVRRKTRLRIIRRAQEYTRNPASLSHADVAR